MKRATHILISALVLLVLLSATPALTVPTTEPAMVQPPSAVGSSSHSPDAAILRSTGPNASSRGLAIVGGSAEQRESADWAVGHFSDAHLELPELVIAIHASDEPCEGFDGVFRSRQTPVRLDVCNPHRLIILHELAHAWDRHTLTDDLRQEFMDLRGLATWNDQATPWRDRGVEDLAEVIVWGLRQFSGSAALNEQPEKEAAFALATGLSISVVRSQIAVTPATAVEQDRPSDGASWDSLH